MSKSVLAISGGLVGAATVLLLAGATVAADRIALKKLLYIEFTTLKDVQLDGYIKAFDTESIEFRDSLGKDRIISWKDVPLKVAGRLTRQCIDNRNPEHWLKAARIFVMVEGGAADARGALKTAVILNPDYKEKAEKLEKELDLDANGTVAKKNTAPQLSSSVKPATGAGPKRPAADYDPTEYIWQKFTDEEMGRFVEEEEQYAQMVSKRLNVKFRKYETEHFLLFTDLNKNLKDVVALHRAEETMYKRVSRLLKIPPTLNVFRGKCLLLLFSDEEMFKAYERSFHGTNITGAAGVCHLDGEGRVRVSFYWNPSFSDLRHTIVHETVHGVLARYRSPRQIPSWLNEGIAEYISYRLVRSSYSKTAGKKKAVQEILKRRSFSGCLDADRIPFWFYGCAEVLVELLMGQDEEAFDDFIRDTKDGLSWRESLLKHYGWTDQGLAGAYAKVLGVAHITLK